MPSIAGWDVAALYMPALAAIQHEPNVKAFYSKLVAAGKRPLQAVVAVMRKLLHAIWGRLSAALGVERRPVQDDGRSAVVLESAHDRRLELEQVGIRQVESLGHCASLTGGSTAFNAAPAPRGRMWLTAAGSEPGPAR